MKLLTTAVSPEQSFMDSHSCRPVCESSTTELIRVLLCVCCVFVRCWDLPGCQQVADVMISEISIRPSVCRYFPCTGSLSECWGLFQFWRSRLITLMDGTWLLSRSLPIPTQNKLLLNLQQPAFWWQLTPHRLSDWSINIFFPEREKKNILICSTIQQKLAKSSTSSWFIFTGAALALGITSLSLDKLVRPYFSHSNSHSLQPKL